MKKILKYLFFLMAFALLIVAFYFSIAYGFTFFPKKSISHQTKAKETVHIFYSNIHSDIVFNIKDINLSNFPQFKEKKNGYLAFGWGDKETYLTTPYIEDIKISTSLKALFINTPSLMHVSYIPFISRYKNIKILKLSKRQKEHLKESIMQSFWSQKKVYKGYGREDFFYTAKGQYNFINTCNTWTGDRLRESNVTMPYWTPFVWSITNSFP